MNYFSLFVALCAFFAFQVQADDGIDTTSYSTSIYNALVEAAEFCQVSYCIQELDRSAFVTGEFECAINYCSEHPNIEVLKIFVAPGASSGTGYIAVDNTGKRILVIFRGSQTIFDWIADLDTIPVPYTPITTDAKSNYTCTDCYAHQGFYESMISFSDEVFPFVKDLKEGNYSDYSIYVSGHSLAGAWANLVGIEFQLMGYEPLVIALAGPKIGNDNLATYMNQIFETPTVIEQISAGNSLTKGFVRVVHQGDIVPLLPPTDYFWHGGAEFYIDKFLLPHPQSVTYFRGDYTYESITQSEVEAFIADDNTAFVLDHIEYFVSMAACVIGDVLTLF